MDKLDVLGNVPIVRARHFSSNMARDKEGRILFYKDFNINEFIGERLASIRNLRTAHYVPTYVTFTKRDISLNPDLEKNKDAVKVATYDFREPGVEYFEGIQLPYYFDAGSFEILLAHCKDEENRIVFIDEYLEMMALDTYMWQTDRLFNALYEFLPNGEVHLAPIFDYERSFISFDIMKYENDFHLFESINDYQEMIDRYPQFAEYLGSYLHIDLEREIVQMADERGFNLDGFNMDKYKRFDKAAHKRLEKILK